MIYGTCKVSHLRENFFDPIYSMFDMPLGNTIGWTLHAGQTILRVVAGILVKGIFAVGKFGVGFLAVRKFRLTEFSPYGIFAK